MGGSSRFCWQRELPFLPHLFEEAVMYVEHPDACEQAYQNLAGELAGIHEPLVEVARGARGMRQ